MVTLMTKKIADIIKNQITLLAWHFSQAKTISQQGSQRKDKFNIFKKIIYIENVENLFGNVCKHQTSEAVFQLHIAIASF